MNFIAINEVTYIKKHSQYEFIMLKNNSKILINKFKKTKISKKYQKNQTT